MRGIELSRRLGLPENVLETNRVFLFDTNSLIYYLSGLEPYFSILKPMVKRVQQAEASLILSVITELVVRVRPEREANDRELERIDELLAEDSVYVMPVTRRLARQAGVIRAQHRLSSPDAIIVATAEAAGCDLIVGNDRQWRGRTVVPFQYLEDLISSP
jgi:predicted nucleic acid-binding protein